MQLNIMSVDEAPGIHVDAFLTDQSYLRFLSVLGRDTEMQEFLARLSLSSKEGGLQAFWVNTDPPKYVQIGDIGRFEKLSGRMPKGNLFGEVTHLWLYDRTAVEPDYAGRRALFLFQSAEDTPENREFLNDRLWSMVRETCHLPLLPLWRDMVLRGFTEHGFLRRLEGVGITAIEVTLPEQEVEAVVTGWIRAGQLSLDGETVRDTEDPFDGAAIYTYTRAQAIADGELVDVTETAREAGFRCPVALTRGVYAECVAWDEEDNERQTYQDEAGRLWDVLWMAAFAARLGPSSEPRTSYQLHCVPRDGKSHTPVLTTLHAHAGPGDNGELVITIMLPHED
ncbi:MAG: DUF6573 family protein [Pseudomonadota bacterium]